MSLEKAGWTLTFYDEFDLPQRNGIYWYPAYRSWRVEYLNRCGFDHNAHYVIEDSLPKPRITETLPRRPEPSHQRATSITTSDHRIGAMPDLGRVLNMFSQKYGWFESRCRMLRDQGIGSAFRLHQVDPARRNTRSTAGGNPWWWGTLERRFQTAGPLYRGCGM